MSGNRKSISVKIPETLLNSIDALIESGVFTDRTDAVIQSLWYQVHKRELRDGLRNDIVQDVTHTVLNNLYSEENEKYFMSLFEKIERTKWNNRFKENK